MKKSGKVALGVFGVTALAATAVLPIGGAVAGAYFAGTGASGAGIGALGSIALGAAGFVGGAIVGKMAILPVAGTAAGIAKLAGVAGRLAMKPFKKKKSAAPKAQTPVEVKEEPVVKAKQKPVKISKVRVKPKTPLGAEATVTVQFGKVANGNKKSVSQKLKIKAAKKLAARLKPF